MTLNLYYRIVSLMEHGRFLHGYAATTVNSGQDEVSKKET